MNQTKMNVYQGLMGVFLISSVSIITDEDTMHPAAQELVTERGSVIYNTDA